MRIFSQVDVGTLISISVPIVDGAVAGKRTIHLAKSDVPSKAKILLCEDDALVLELVSSILSDAGYDVVTATSGSDGQRLLDEHRSTFDLLLSDVSLPTGSGIELAGHARATCPNMSVLLMTGHPDNLTDAVANSDAFIVTKPFSNQQLLDAVAKELEPLDRAYAH